MEKEGRERKGKGSGVQNPQAVRCQGPRTDKDGPDRDKNKRKQKIAE